MSTARDCMVTDLLLLTPELGVHEAMRRLLEREVSGAPVVDEHGGLVGILTERDCLQVVYRASYFKEPGGSVGDVMTTDVETIDADEGIIAVIERFLRSRYRRFPVLDGTRLVGQLSRRDILDAVVKLW